MRNTKGTEGFSLVEVAIGLLIVGLIVGPMIEQYGAWKTKHVNDVTRGNAGDAQSALTKYVKNYGCYPLPAPPGLAATAAAAGKEGVRATGDCTDLTAGQLSGIPICAGSDAVVCKVACTATAGSNCATLGSVILIGDIPHATLGLPKEVVVDGYGRKYTYAVSANLTGTTGFDNGQGVVTVSDTNGKGPATAGNPPGSGPPVSDAHYVLISHGQDAAGSYTLEGVLAAPCPAVGADPVNCRYTGGTFNNGYDLFTDAYGVEYGRVPTLVAGAAHFDDFVFYTNNIYTDYWTKQAVGGSVGDIVSNNKGSNVKIKQPLSTGGPALPQAKLDVRGDLTADAIQTDMICDTSANTYAASTYTNMKCQADNINNPAVTNAFSPSVLATAPATITNLDGTPHADTGVSIHCGVWATGVPGNTGTAANPMTGIASVDEKCAGTTSVKAPTTYNITACPAGQWAYGIDVSGNRMCSTYPHP